MAVTTYQYDALGRLIRNQRSRRGSSVRQSTTDYRYDAVGNQVQVIRAQEREPARDHFTYNALGKQVRIDYPDTTPDVTYSYDAWQSRHDGGWRGHMAVPV
jgi:hypothetical protein